MGESLEPGYFNLSTWYIKLNVKGNMTVSCDGHVMIMWSCDGHVVVMWGSCGGHVVVMWWSCDGHVMPTGTKWLRACELGAPPQMLQEMHSVE